MQKVRILGVQICKATMNECIAYLRSLIKDEKQHYFVTPNPEIILEAQKDEEYRKILNEAALQTADGAGILWAAKKYGKKLPERVTGVEIMERICEKIPKKIFLLGAGKGIAEKAKTALEKKYPNISIVGTFSGSPKEEDEENIIKKINKSEAEILFVAYGAPAQEKWIVRNLTKMPKIKLAGGIGGSFDFISGNKARAPKWMRKIGIEWLFRLIQEPKRWKRIYNATIKFPFKVLTNKE